MALDAELGPDYPEEPAQDSSAEGVPATDSSLPLSPAAAHEADRAFREGHRAIAPGGPDGVDSGDDEVASAETSERFVADTRPATPTTLATARAVLADAMQENTSESAEAIKHEETSDQQEVKVEPDVSEPMEMATQAEVSDAPATVDETPRPEASPLSAEEVPQHASDLLRQLQGSATTWRLTNEEPSAGGTVRTYEYSQPADPADTTAGTTFFTAQLCYEDTDDTGGGPTYGSLVITKPTPGGGMAEYFCHTRPTDGNNGEQPHIEYDAFPFHREDLSRPVENTVGAYQGARGLIGQLPRLAS